MYIRGTTIKSRKEGSQYYTYRLVESERTQKDVSQRTLINLGTGFSLPRNQWPELTSRIGEILGGQRELFKHYEGNISEPTTLEKMIKGICSHPGETIKGTISKRSAMTKTLKI
jgi:hypothetical protein